MAKTGRSIRLHSHEWDYIERIKNDKNLPDTTSSISRILIEHEVLRAMLKLKQELTEESVIETKTIDTKIKGEFDF